MKNVFAKLLLAFGLAATSFAGWAQPTYPMRTVKVIKPKVDRAWKADPDAIMLRPFWRLDAIHRSALAP